jgi:hypothetical protein
MPSLKTKQKTSNSRKIATARGSQKMLFWPVVALTFILWVAYRTLFDFPVWFDETLGKAIFFALPVWFFIMMTQNKEIVEAFSIAKIKQGLLQGIAFGGMFGFAASLVSLFSRGVQLQAAPLFMSDAFWWEFFLALMTGFWETLFFFAFVMTLIQMIYKKWPLLNQVLLTSCVFILFHIPNLVHLFSGRFLLGYIFLIWAFSIGQAFIYARRQNAYTLVISHAIWGMVLLVHVAN